MLNTRHKVEDHENHVRWIYFTAVLYMGESQKYASIKLGRSYVTIYVQVLYMHVYIIHVILYRILFHVDEI